jgi:trk system potassium uptake protein TrkH
LSGGFLYFLFVEWSHSLNDLDVVDRIVNSWFQSVTTRTAGFNSVNLVESRGVTQLFFMVLMFIGGNPGSTAGGVKTVTIAILAIAGYSALKKRDAATAFGKRIPHKTIYQALLVLTLGVLIHFISFFFLSVTQNVDTISLLFETFSALGTVGLSTGATNQLDEIGKAIIIFCMLAGRVGPITFILLLMKQSSQRNWKVPQEDVSIT